MVNQEHLGERLEAIMFAKGVSAAQVAESENVSVQAVYKWLNTGQIARKRLIGIARLLGVTVDKILIGGTGIREPQNSYGNIEPAPEVEGRCPLISWVAAGNWSSTSDPLQPGDAEEWLDCPVPHSSETYVLRVRGDSMSPDYPAGELIFVDPNTEARPGRDVIARLIDRDETTFKRYKVEDGRPYLLALNPNWPERYISINEKAVIKGVVIFSGKKR